MAYNVDWILREVARELQFDPTKVGQDFHGGAADPWAVLKAYLNRAYTRLINELKEEVPNDWFKGNHSLVWPTDQVTLQLPTNVQASGLLAFVDVTYSSVGEELPIYSSRDEGTPYWLTEDTIQWGESGPANDRTFKIEYFMDAEELTEFGQVPRLIPYANRYALVWTTLVTARDSVDEDMVPTSWRSNAEQEKSLLIIKMSKGKLRRTNQTGMLDSYYRG